MRPEGESGGFSGSFSRKKKEASEREGFFERVSEWYKAIDIIRANENERALELEALALEAQREFEAALRERGGT